MDANERRSANGGRMPLAVAERIAQEVCAWLKPVVEEVLVVGSIRRRRPTVGDIDLVIRPAPPPADLLGSPAMDADRPLSAHLAAGRRWPGRIVTVTADGGMVKRFVWAAEDFGAVDIDLYLADERTWPTIVLIRTGSAGHNVKLCMAAQERGMTLKANGDGIIDAFGKPMPIASERDIFAALGMDYVRPEDREV